MQQEHRLAGFNKSHGMTDTRLYNIWLNMKERCKSKTNKYYGQKGISVCKEWEKFPPFAEWALSHGYTDDMTIERVDVNGNYEPQNCKWITAKNQYLNRTDSHYLTAFGKTQTIKEWATETGIAYDTIERRINAYGWTAEDAVGIKSGRNGRNKHEPI